MDKVNLKTLFRFSFIAVSTFLLTACSTRQYQPIHQAEMAYRTGQYSEALSKLASLATTGDPKAQYALGYMYYYGMGTNKDLTLGHYWIEQAAKNGDPVAIEAASRLREQKTIHQQKPVTSLARNQFGTNPLAYQREARSQQSFGTITLNQPRVSEQRISENQVQEKTTQASKSQADFNKPKDSVDIAALDNEFNKSHGGFTWDFVN